MIIWIKKNKLNNINEKDGISTKYKFTSSLNNYNKNNDGNWKDSTSTNYKNIISSKNYKNIEVIDNLKGNKKQRLQEHILMIIEKIILNIIKIM
jgi:hypothetical protein